MAPSQPAKPERTEVTDHATPLSLAGLAVLIITALGTTDWRVVAVAMVVVFALLINPIWNGVPFIAKQLWLRILALVLCALGLTYFGIHLLPLPDFDIPSHSISAANEQNDPTKPLQLIDNIYIHNDSADTMPFTCYAAAEAEGGKTGQLTAAEIITIVNDTKAAAQTLMDNKGAIPKASGPVKIGYTYCGSKHLDPHATTWVTLNGPPIDKPEYRKAWQDRHITVVFSYLIVASRNGVSKTLGPDCDLNQGVPGVFPDCSDLSSL